MFLTRTRPDPSLAFEDVVSRLRHLVAIDADQDAPLLAARTAQSLIAALEAARSELRWHQLRARVTA